MTTPSNTRCERRGSAPGCVVLATFLALVTASPSAETAPVPDPAGGAARVERLSTPPVPAPAEARPASGALPPPQAVEFTGGRVEIPLLLFDGRPVVEATIDGRGPFHLGIETGAAFVGLTRATLDSLHVTPVRHDESGEVDSLGTLTVGGATFRGVLARDVAPVDPRIDGFLGLGAFESVLLTIDYPARRVLLERGTLPAPDGRGVFAATRIGPFFAVALDMAGRRIDAVIDTRGSSAFGVTPAIGDSLRFNAPPVLIGQARGAAIPLSDVRLGRLAGDIRCGAIVFERPFVTVRALPPGFPGALLGSETLAHFAFSLDQRTSRVRLVAASPGPVPPPRPLSDLGLRLRQRPGELPEVGEVRAGTPADSLGIRPGDRVLEAGGIAGADMEPARWRALSAAGRPVPLKLRRGEQTLELVLRLAILVP
jgi:hypothetical protein